MMRRLGRSRRYALKNYDARFREIVDDRQALLSFLIETYPSFLARVGASQVNHFTPNTLHALAELENTLWVGIGTPQHVEAVYVFGFTPHIGDCLLNVATPEGREHSTLLLWYGALELKRRNVPLLNLGGGVRRGDGVAQSKERFRAHVSPLRALKQVFQPDVYDALCQQAGVEPRDRTGYFPNYYRSLLNS
jgi:hypothetical protein